MDKTIIISVLSMAGLGGCFALVLAIANQKLHVKEDPRVEKIEAALPGLNCGACGFPGCAAYARALAEGGAAANACVVGGAKAAQEIAEVLGIEACVVVKKLPIVHCGADRGQRTLSADYVGIRECKAANLVSGGGINCSYGCLGFGDCASACPQDVIRMVDGLPQVNLDECIGCGKCVSACPRRIISMEEVNKDRMMLVACNSKDKCPVVRKACPVGCIGCGLCAKLSGGIFIMEGKLALVDYAKVNELGDWEMVAGKCPTKAIKIEKEAKG